MTKVDFYLMQPEYPGNVVQVACILVEKAVHQKQPVHIHTGDAAISKKLDEALWCYKPESFIPHTVLQEPRNSISSDDDTLAEQAVSAPNPAYPRVTIASHTFPEDCRGVMINLAQEVPVFFSRFSRTLEIVGSDNSLKAKSRERYRFYQQRGYPLAHHPLG